jgi:urease subunit gamma/beta
VRLTELEQERLLIFTAAELARRRLARGLRLNHPEAIAIICDVAHEAARDGASYDEVVRSATNALRPDDVLDGVPDLLDEIRFEVLVGDGNRLVVLVNPLGTSDPDAQHLVPGQLLPMDRRAIPPREHARQLEIRNASRRVVRVGSHYPLERVNARLILDRAAAVGYRLDILAGDSERWSPGETKVVGVVPLRTVPPSSGPDTDASDA